MSDDYHRFAALSGLDAWITREPEELPCEHKAAKWIEDDTILYCGDCDTELRVVGRSEPCAWPGCENVAFPTTGSAYCLADDCAGRAEVEEYAAGLLAELKAESEDE